MALPKETNSLTYADYLKLDDDIQYEVINGQIYNMSPSPNVKHQTIEMELSTEFNVYLRNKSCKVLAEIDVCLTGEEDSTKVKEWVKPDIVVICDQNKIQKSHIAGAPDLIVEIISKSTAKIDKMIKTNRYQRAGVKEYWIVDLVHETIDVYVLENGSYKHHGTFANDELVEVTIFDDFSISLNTIFREE